MSGKLREMFRRQAPRLLALATMATALGFARLPTLPDAQRSTLAARFSFSRTLLPELAGRKVQQRRTVNPNLEPIAAWISAVGAAVALNDIDADGLPNDLCYVDPRIDEITVAPVPGTGDRYAPFALSPEPLPFDRSTMAPMGCLPADLNEDGRMDLLAYYWGRTPIAFMRAGAGYRPIEISASGERWYSNAATVADLDGDGHNDLLVTNYFQDGARILDANARVPDQMQHSMSRAYNGGSTRFFVWAGAVAGPEPSVTFREIHDVMQAHHASAWTLAVAAADLDGDLLPELYFANDFGPDRLLHNRSQPGTLRFASVQGERGFSTPASKALGRDSFKGMGVDAADVNGDGLLDLFVSNIAAEYALHESHFMFVSTGEPQRMAEGIAPYVDESETLGLSRSDWSWDSKLADFDNDGVMEALQATGFVKGEVNRWPELQELAIGNDELLPDARVWLRARAGDDLSGHAPNRFYVKAADGRYYDIASSLNLAQPQVTRGIATADVDGDGDLDFALANQWEASHFYRNDCPRCGASLGLHLRVPVAGERIAGVRVHAGHPHNPGRPAIGASVTVTLPGGRRQVAQVDGGNGHSGKRSPDLLFGLGDLAADTPVKVGIRWRDASGTVREQSLSLAAGWHTVMLGESEGN